MQDSWSRDYKDVQRLLFSFVIAQTLAFMTLDTQQKFCRIIFLPFQCELAQIKTQWPGISGFSRP